MGVMLRAELCGTVIYLTHARRPAYVFPSAGSGTPALVPERATVPPTCPSESERGRPPVAKPTDPTHLCFRAPRRAATAAPKATTSSPTPAIVNGVR